MKNLIYYLFLALIPFLFSCKHEKTFKIGISQCSSDDWRHKMNEEINLEGMLQNDVIVEIRSANDDSQQQIKDIEYFVKNKFDVIVVAPNEAEALTPEIKKVHKKGIPIVIFDRNINDTTYTQRISVDNVGLGLSAAEYARSAVHGPLNILEIYGLQSSTPARERSRGFHQGIDEFDDAIVLGSGPGDWQQDRALKVADSLLEMYPQTNLIFAHNDRMALGAYEAALKAGRSDIKIIGIDAAPNIGIQGVADGKITATFLYPTEGHRILQEAVKIARGEPFDREVLLPTTSAVDATNVDILQLQNSNIEEDTRKVLALKSQLDNYVSLHNAQTALFYAIIAILVLLFGVLFLVLRTFWSHRRHQAMLVVKNRQLEEERDKQKELNERLEEATQSKLVFFTNVSHDLRTPLTLIAEPVAKLKEADNLTTGQHSLMKIADKNIKILHRLINQILDFRKFENNKLDLHLTEVNFNKCVSDWLESFHALAEKRDIKLKLKEPPQEIHIAMDVEKMERVFFNLISNAIKYSPDNTTITVEYFEENGNLVLRVEDQGEGISKADMANIFDRFFQVDRVRPHGSGIGLSLAKAFVELHEGTITLESELKKGTVFTVQIPMRHISDTVTEVTKNITSEDISAELDIIEAEPDSFSDDKPLLLVIDDNKDIREMVTELMKEDYNVILAPNGREGIRKAMKYVPDLIVCDVMMPGIDGMECCSRLKNETITSHIPVLMLTACTLDEQRVQGFDSGADGYIAKPFSTAVLKAQAASLISNRKLIKDVYSASNAKIPDTQEKGSVPKTNSQPVAGDIDNDFYNRFLKLFDKKMGEADLNVEAMAAELGFERTQLYRKIKAITNYSPVELMRNLRLKKARTLLNTTDKSVSEICYEVGFSTPAYFTKCYKEQYGETPSETRER